MSQTIRQPLRIFSLRSSERYLRWGVMLSLAVHVLLIAWQRNVISPPPPAMPELEMILVNGATQSSPVKPVAFAQANIDGGGDFAQGIASHAQERTGIEAQNIVIDAMTRRRLQLEAEQKELLTLLEAKTLSSESRPVESYLKNPIRDGKDETDQESVARNAALAAVSEEVKRYNQRPRKYFDAPSTKAHPYANYIDDVRKRIEKTGTQYYPGSSANRAYGSLQASITIAADGKVVDITIDRPAKQAILNQSVRRIVSLAGQFPPFPPDMRRNIDQIVITRTWHFVNGALQTKSQ
jgi:protein TonB